MITAFFLGAMFFFRFFLTSPQVKIRVQEAPMARPLRLSTSFHNAFGTRTLNLKKLRNNT